MIRLVPTTLQSTTTSARPTQSLPTVLGGVRELQFITPDTQNEDINDTFKVSFQNTRKCSLVETYHCSGYKKMCMVKYVQMPEYQSASTDVSMTSLGSASSLNVQEVQTPIAGFQTRPNPPMTPSGSQLSLMSASSRTSLTSIGQSDKQTVQGQFSTTLGTPKQTVKTIAMPTGGAFDTEVQIARANLPHSMSGSQMFSPATQPESQMIQGHPATISPRPITKKTEGSDVQTQQVVSSTASSGSLSMTEAILQGVTHLQDQTSQAGNTMDVRQRR